MRYEYWTNAGLATGSDHSNPHTTAGAEIIVPVERIKMLPSWPKTSAQESPAGGRDLFTFTNLRWFKNWADMGIAYAYPNLGENNFWGVINHDNEEGIFRIANNTLTPGLKIWTFGYASASIDPFKDGAEWRRPFIELWAGVTTEFWKRAICPAQSEITIPETYAPTLGLSTVTQASDNFLANVSVQSGAVEAQVFALYPNQSVVVTLLADGGEIYSASQITQADRAITASAVPPLSAKTVELRVGTPSGTTLFDAVRRLR